MDYKILKEKISSDNVLAMAELIALNETKYLIGYMGSRMQKIYAYLYADRKHKNEAHYVQSDAYDLVQGCAVFLCESCNITCGFCKLFACHLCIFISPFFLNSIESPVYAQLVLTKRIANFL